MLYQGLGRSRIETLEGARHFWDSRMCTSSKLVAKQVMKLGSSNCMHGVIGTCVLSCLIRPAR